MTPPIDRREYRRRVWARALIDRAAKPIPPYGSDEWHQLPEACAERIAAVVIAAECWALDGDDLPSRLARELDDRSLAEKHATDWIDQQAASEHAEQWAHLSRSGVPFTGQPVPPRPLEQVGREHLRLVRGDAS